MPGRSPATGHAVAYLLLSGGLIVAVFPYLWMVLASFKEPAEIYSRFLPTQVTLDHYRFILGGNLAGVESAFLRSLLNSLILSVVATVSVVFFGAITGYALAKLDFWGKRALNRFILLQMLFPPILLLIPRFLLILNIRMVNTYEGMLLPFLMSAWGTFLFVQFFRTIPSDLLDAARMDGCSETRIVFRIVLPLSRSVTAIVAIFTFMAVWDEFLWFLIVSKEYELMPLSVLLGLFTKGRFENYPGIQTAGATLLTLPLLGLFFLFRGYFTEGIIMSGLKR